MEKVQSPNLVFSIEFLFCITAKMYIIAITTQKLQSRKSHKVNRWQVLQAVTSFCEAVMLAKEVACYRLAPPPRTAPPAAAGSSPSDQEWIRVDSALCSTAPQVAVSIHWRDPMSGQLSARATGSNEIPHSRQPEQFMERLGFLVSKSLTLPAAPPWAAGVIRWFPRAQKKDESVVQAAGTG